MPDTVSLVPSPRILVAITHNPMKPVDALCELVDNAIDSFAEAERSGNPTSSPLVQISLPKLADVEAGIGSISVHDNGPGLGADEARNAVTAGFSSHDPFSMLGLFGMGFNIASGKIGRKTDFATCRASDPTATAITIDFDAMLRRNTFEAPRVQRPKASPDQSGTQVKVSEWWPVGTQNAGFVAKLVRLGLPNIAAQLGRRYATLIREKGIRIRVNDVECIPYRHCIWGDNRSVERREYGRIPSVIRFDELLGTEVRCYRCGGLVENREPAQCVECGSAGIVRTRERRVKGWVGIQRFDSMNQFGIDLVRMGRAIRIGEQEAFFTWTNSKGDRVLDYPIDSIYGRVVGEVHLDHVPTDFLKQDFQRASSEWYEATKFLRGESTLQPQKREQWGEPENISPIYRLYQGYRKVRDFGTRDMYMGYWQHGAQRPERILRKTEEEYYRKFLDGVPGYVDDTEWWKLVEQADQRPQEEMKECPGCGEQCLATAEKCLGCGHVFFPKTCSYQDCGKEIPKSAVQCPHCGASQPPAVVKPWCCGICGHENPPETDVCRSCRKRRGEQNPFELNYLLEHSERMDELCRPNFSIPLPEEVQMPTAPVEVFRLKDGISLERSGFTLPAITHQSAAGLQVFLDLQHPIFLKFQDRHEDVLSIELARWVGDRNLSRVSDQNRPLWSISSLYWQIHNTVWAERLELDPEETSRRIDTFFSRLREELSRLFIGEGEDIWRNMDARTQGEIAKNLVQNGIDVGRLHEMVKDSSFLIFLPEDLIVEFFVRYPTKFFDGSFWTDAYETISLADPESLADIKRRIVRKYQNFLDDIVAYIGYKNPDSDYTLRVDQTLNLLEKNLASSVR